MASARARSCKRRYRDATSMRIGWSDGSIIAVGLYAKGASKSSVAVHHARLPDRDTAERLKQFWTERLDALSDVLSPIEAAPRACRARVAWR